MCLGCIIIFLGSFFYGGVYSICKYMYMYVWKVVRYLGFVDIGLVFFYMIRYERCFSKKWGWVKYFFGKVICG